MMTLVGDREQWVALVLAAQKGDAAVWSALIDRFEDLAMATAVGLCGDLDEAADIAQEAFALAFRHIADLKSAEAFPAWLLRLVRTATSRRTRRRRHALVSLDSAPSDHATALVDEADLPDEVVLNTIEMARVRAAVERLAEGERCVIALHYLAGMPYVEVADFLSISVSAAKKRAWSARSHLKELLPMVADAFAAARPSDNKNFRDTILLFQAIRLRDAAGLARLLDHNPSLASVSEDWSAPEGFESRLGFSERATALIRAAGTGDLELVQLLVDAGASVSDLCECPDNESALVAAVNLGATDIVDYLLEHGASPNDAAFDGESTALHVAVHRDHHDLVPRLLAAGADPTATDANGRTAADWGALRAARPADGDNSDVLWTRIRAIDLFAPLHRGSLVHLPPAYGVGAMRAVFGVVDALQPAQWWMIGFEHGPYEPGEFEQETRESGTPATIDLVGSGSASDRRRTFAHSLERLASTAGPKVVMCVPAPGHEHDITVALPGLAADPSILATVVVAPYTSDPEPVADALTEGFDARITFDRVRAQARWHPAIDPAHTVARTYPDARHERIADAARDLLSRYAIDDPDFALPDPGILADTAGATRSQALFRYLSHAFRPFEMLAGTPASDTPLAELLDTVDDLISGVEPG